MMTIVVMKIAVMKITRTVKIAMTIKITMKMTDYDDNEEFDDADDENNDDDEEEVSLTEWVPSLSLTDRLLMSCLHQSLIKLSLIYGGGDDHHDGQYDVAEVESGDDNQLYHHSTDKE